MQRGPFRAAIAGLKALRYGYEREGAVSSLEHLGWNSFFEDQRQRSDRSDLLFARVIEMQRGWFRVAGEFEGLVEVSGRFRYDHADSAHGPAVGDWVGVRTADAVDRGVIHVLLERQSTVSRVAAGEASAEQVLAANVDTIFVVCALAEDFNLRRIERYLTIAWNAGATPVILLTKADICDDVAAACRTVRQRVPFADVMAVSAVSGAGLEALDAYLRPGQTIVLLGSSGVGKSTLVNRLIGREKQRVGAIREADGRGRHVTTARQLFEVRGGALLIDTPGLREVQAFDGESAVAGAFDDVHAIAGQCRFADCAHEREPGCGVLEAVSAGRLDADRLEHFRRLTREAAFDARKHDKALAANTKRRWKQIHKAAREMYRDRERDRS